jgi:tetratricopeptide repeat protein 30
MHLCVVNLAVGTLYCARGNASFGVRRVVKALTPLDARLTPDTWYYVKRCLLAVAEGVAKRVAPPLDDDVARELAAFLAGVDAHGRRAGSAAAADAAAASVSGEGVGDDMEVEECDADMRREARTLRRLFMLVREW